MGGETGGKMSVLRMSVDKDHVGQSEGKDFKRKKGRKGRREERGTRISEMNEEPQKLGEKGVRKRLEMDRKKSARRV